MRHLILVLFLFGVQFAEAQKLKKEDKQLLTNLEKHVQFLASDKLEGRRTGTQGEQLAMQYIATEFKTIGLEPKGTREYFQPFNIDEGKEIGASTHLIIDENNLVLNKDFFPLIYSSNISIEALPSIALQENGMPWFLDLKETLEGNANNPHFDVANALLSKAKEVAKKGASSLFVYNTSNIEDELKFNGKDRIETIAIPVIYVGKEAAKKYFSDESATLDIKLKVDIGKKLRTGNNVIGYINNNAATTVVIGAHYDHLGYGEDGNSFSRNEKTIHNGADDNASGTGAMIELARMLKGSKLNQNNYLFIAFSGEELGLYGSKYFVENPTVDIKNINYMVNLDMIGRLSDSTNTITVGGFGTSPEWGNAYNTKGKNKLYNTSLVFRYDSSGTGPSDHTSFYRKNIPVLFYFTGLHKDYHRPTDDIEKINYNGTMQIVKHIYSLIEMENKPNNKLAFAATREAQTNSTASFSVTLGIMPDYTFAGQGVRVDGISENKPAQKAGIKTGDIIVQLGNLPVNSLDAYMKALANFKKGDKTTVSFNRGAEKLSANIEF